jgi:hypothetical protein
MITAPSSPSSFGRWLIALAIAMTSFAASAADVQPPAVTNPPPDVAFSTFTHFEVKPIEMGAPYAGQEANEKAKTKIQQNLDQRLKPLVDSWNSKADASKPAKTLVLAPHIVEIRFINGTARVWAGAFAGNSGVLMRIDFIDQSTGKTIASPVFYQRANKHGGAWSFGATDNNMLVRISEVATNYIKANYESAVGGPTGADAPKK